MGPIGIELTNLCNFNCYHCYVHKNKLSEKTLELEQYKKILDFLATSDFISLFLTGGEPFNICQFDEYYNYAIEKGFLTTIFTNGFILTEKIKKVLKQRRPYSLEISVYGMSDESYLMITGVNNVHNVIFKNIEWMIKEGINIELKYVLMKHNFHELEAFTEYACKNEINYFINPALFPLYNGKEIQTHFRLLPSDLKKVSKRYPEKVNINTLHHEFKCDAGELLYINSMTRVKGCPVLTEEYFVDWDVISIDELERIINNIKLDVGGKPYNYCPAWEEIEDAQKISSVLGII